jgi:putative FmdB family regulatory protein
MPTYEYRCLECQNAFSVFMTYEEFDQKSVTCSHCESAHITRLIKPIRVARSEESRLESLADPAALAGLDDDPQALGKMMRRMSSELGEEMGPEFDEVVDRLEKGQSPDEIEKDLPDLGLSDDM